jgi:hypothetical protein
MLFELTGQHSCSKALYASKSSVIYSMSSEKDDGTMDAMWVWYEGRLYGTIWASTATSSLFFRGYLEKYSAGESEFELCCLIDWKGVALHFS